jgi:predicted NAD-dependent protein-ADP-ribosyltransferase YbiA (DUF1768 family)
MDFFLGSLSARIKPEYRPMAATIVELLAQHGPLTTHDLAERLGSDSKSRCRSVLNTMQQLRTIISFQFKGLDGRNYNRWRLAPETEVALGSYPVASQLVTEHTEPKGLHNWQMENHVAFKGSTSPWAPSPPPFTYLPPRGSDMPPTGLSAASSAGSVPPNSTLDEPSPVVEPSFSMDRFSTPDPRVREAMAALPFPSFIPPVSLRLGVEAHREPDTYDIHSGQCMNVLPFCSDRPSAIGCVLSNFWNHRYSDPDDDFWCAELHFQYIKVSRYAKNPVVSMKALKEMLSLEPVDPLPIGTEGWEDVWQHNQALCKKIKSLAGRECPHGDLDLDIDRWDDDSFDVMRSVLAHKFRMRLDNGKFNPLAQYLCSTSSRWLIEAAHYDRVWGIGLTSGDHYPESKSSATPLLRMRPDGREEWNVQPADWLGKNFLGIALMQQRTTLITSWPDSTRPSFAVPTPLQSDA